MTFQIRDKEDKLIYESGNIVKVWAYDIARHVYFKTDEEAKTCASLAYEMWIRDENKTPVGDLMDFVPEHINELLDMVLMRDRLKFFYEEAIL